MEHLQTIEAKVWATLDRIAERQEEYDRQAAERKAEYDREAAERKAEADRQAAEYKREAAERKAEYDKQAAERKVEYDKQAAKYAAEAAERKAEADKRAAEADKRAAEAEIRKAEADRTMEALKKRVDETSETVNKLSKELGGISSNNGYFAEEFFQNSFAQSLEFAGIKFDVMIPNFRPNGKKKGAGEFDIVLLNGNSVAIIEAKYRIHPDFVKKLAEEKLPLFRKLFPLYKDFSVYLGVAGMSFDRATVENAKEYGMAVVRQEGKHVVVDSSNMKVY